MATDLITDVARTPGWISRVLAKRLCALLLSAQGLAILDQFVVSGTSFATTILIGRAAGAAELGSYAIAVSVFATVIGVQNALILLPFSIQQHRPEQQAEARAGTALLLSAGLALLAIAAAALHWLGYALAGVGGGWLALSCAISGILPFVLVREFARRLMFAKLRVLAALVLDLAVSLVQLAGLAVMARAQVLDAVSACICFGLACGVPALAWTLAARKEFQFSRTAIGQATRDSWQLGKWLMLGQITVQIQSYSAYWLIMAIGGAAATGVFAACMSIVGFANPLLFGVSNVLTPKQALAWRNGGSAGLLREALGNTLLLGGMMAALCIVLAVASERLLQLFFGGGDYVGYGHVASVLGFAMLATAIGMPASNALAAMERPRAIVVVGGVGGLVTIMLTAVLMQRWGVLGAAYGGLAGSAVGALGRWLAFVAVARKSDAEAPVDAAVLRLADCGGDAHVQRLGEGDFATVFLVTPRQGAEPVVVKLYRQTSKAGLAQEQYDALTRLHAALDGREAHGWRMRIPRPIAVSDAPQALTMTAVSGHPLDSGLIDGDTARASGRAFARLMQRAWSNGLLHGDLNSSNVLLDSNAHTLSLIDPGPGVSCTACNAKQIAPAARDLGHLVVELTTDLNDVIGQPTGRMQKQNFVTAALQNAELCEAEEIRHAALWHMAQALQPSWSPRGIWNWLVRAVAERRSADLLGQLASSKKAVACSRL